MSAQVIVYRLHSPRWGAYEITGDQRPDGSVWIPTLSGPWCLLKHYRDRVTESGASVLAYRIGELAP